MSEETTHKYFLLVGQEGNRSVKRRIEYYNLDMIIDSSERNLYQQVTDIYATAVDYNPRADITRQFFATVQNKMHYAAHQHTAAEVIYQRVDADKPMVGMTNFKGD